MIDTLLGTNPVILAALVSALVSLATTLLATPLRLAVDKQMLRHKLRTEYEYEQRKKLRDLIGRYHGRMLEAAETLSHRFWNLYENEAKGWLNLGGKYEEKIQDSYYFRTTIYRFLVLYALARRFECESIYVDARIAEKNELDFLKFLKALVWAATDAVLFGGEQYDTFYAKDHFFRDHLRQMCDTFQENDVAITLEDFGEFAVKEPSMHYALRYFDGLKSAEDRLRWDRTVVIHLILMTFINAFGYDMQNTSKKQLSDVVSKIKHDNVLRNLNAWLVRLGLEKQKDVRLLRKVLSVRVEVLGAANG